MHSEPLMNAPEVAGMLGKWDLNTDSYTSMSIWGINNDVSHADTAIWWLNNNPGVWRQWLTEEAAPAMQGAIEVGERAEGWLTNR